MTPNLFLVTQKVLSPHKWFRTTPKTERPTRVTEYWSTPEPGQYEYVPGRGWFMIAKLTDPVDRDDIKSSENYSTDRRELVRLPKPIPAHRSRVLGRYLLEDEYKLRKKTGEIKNERGKRVQAGFFRLDNPVAWVHCWDENGTFIPGGETGYKLWCIDTATQQFRHMKKGDDPNFIRSRPSSPRERDVNRRSEESVSTAYRSGPASTRDGPSAPSTRASSIRGPLSNPTSSPSSRVQSRRNSPRRNNSIPLEEAKAALRRMAKEQEEAVTAAAAAKTRTNSKGTVQQIERGRPMMRVAN
ncbi:hypothetical protein CC86DRAFT_32572 [Ophiobolus disseminans]|uniref:Uncharacterized protein n=1 Tax=Ophiobolus disseminans TaxID=1469910 RepID=A0A6A6ZXI5_9PLEO|nr:hypothetical protein CC86DRAFT_32572 [Ophiobolus disseminans]